MSPEAVGDQAVVIVTQEAADLAKELAESFTLGGHEYTRKYEVTRVSSRRHELSRNLLKALEVKPAPVAAEAPAPKVSQEMVRMRKAQAVAALEKLGELTKENEVLRARVETLESELTEAGLLHEPPEKDSTSLTVTPDDSTSGAEGEKEAPAESSSPGDPLLN